MEFDILSFKNNTQINEAFACFHYEACEMYSFILMLDNFSLCLSVRDL